MLKIKRESLEEMEKNRRKREEKKCNKFRQKMTLNVETIKI